MTENVKDTTQRQPLDDDLFEWLWPGFVNAFGVTFVRGEWPEIVTLDMAARVSSGKPWPTADSRDNPAGSVLMLNAKESPSVLREKLTPMGADLDRIVMWPDTGLDTPDTVRLSTAIPDLEDTLALVGDVRLVVIDPLSAYLGGDTQNDVVGLMADFAHRHGVAVVAVADQLPVGYGVRQRFVYTLTVGGGHGSLDCTYPHKWTVISGTAPLPRVIGFLVDDGVVEWVEHFGWMYPKARIQLPNPNPRGDAMAGSTTERTPRYTKPPPLMWTLEDGFTGGGPPGDGGPRWGDDATDGGIRTDGGDDIPWRPGWASGGDAIDGGDDIPR